MNSSYSIPKGYLKVKINPIRTKHINHCYINGDICYVNKSFYATAMKNIKRGYSSTYNTTVPLIRCSDGISQYICIAEFNIISNIDKVEII